MALSAIWSRTQRVASPGVSFPRAIRRSAVLCVYLCICHTAERTAVWPNLHTSLSVNICVCVCIQVVALWEQLRGTPRLTSCSSNCACHRVVVVITPACDRQLRVAHTVEPRRGRVTDTVDTAHTLIQTANGCIRIHIHSRTPCEAYFVIFCI